MRARRARAAAATALALVLVAGCAAIPTSGPIGTGDVEMTVPAQPIPLANDPQLDGSVEAIVQGFLVAGAAGLADQFGVARSYLTGNATSTWAPTERLLVYPARSQPEIVPDEAAGTAVVSLTVQGTVDAAGVYTEAPPDAREELAFELVRDSQDQWRIVGLDDVVVMSSSDFAAFYREAPVYFATLDEAYLVPDVRWLPATTAAASAVRALLAGPSAWLRDVVRTGAPEGTRLGAAGVVVSDLTTVDLSGSAAEADAEQRALLQAQLAATLERLPGTADDALQVTVAGGEPWAVAPTAPPRDPQPGAGPYVVADGRLEVLSDGELLPADVPPLPPGVGALAFGPELDPVVGLLAGQGLVRLPADGSAPVVLLPAGDLVAPSVDRFGWVWTSVSSSDAGLVAVSVDGEPVAVTADWLTGSRVVGVAASRDGSRIAVAHTGSRIDQVVLDVAAVERDEAGRPVRLGAGLQVGASLNALSQVEWLDEDTLVVLGLSGSLVAPALHLVPVGGPSQALSGVDGTVAIAAGQGDRALYLLDDDGVLLWRQGAAWVPVATDVSDPAFPG